MGLLPIAVILKSGLERLPPFTIAERRLRGRLGVLELLTAVPPEEHVEQYISLLPGEPQYVVFGYELVFWRPDRAGLTIYLEDRSEITSNVSEIEKVIERYRRMPIGKSQVVREKIDEIDLKIIKEKHKYAFKKLREISKVVGISHQTLSYHFRRHVRKIWYGNRIGLFLDANVVPFRVYIFEGRDAPALAKTLVELPYFHSALIGEERAYIVAQPFDSIREYLNKVIKEIDVHMPFGELIMELKMKRKIPGYTCFFKNGKWILPIEEHVEAKER